MTVFAAPNGENLLLGKGQVMFDRFDSAGLRTGFKHLGNVETLEITTNDDKVQKFSSMSKGSPLLKEANRRRTVTLKITGNEFTPDNVALALMGSTAVLVQAATAIVAEPVFASTVKGSFFKLAKLGPYTGIAVKFGATTGVLGTDYVIADAAMGIIQILAGTALTGAVTVDYTPTAYTSSTGPVIVGGGNAAFINGALLFVGDPAAGPKSMLEVWKLSLSSDAALGLISDDFATLGFSGNVLDDTPNHPANPLYQLTYAP